MEEMIITNEMREKINHYLGFELIKENEVGHHIYDEAPGLGRIGIEGNELHHVVTNKQLDGNGNVEWYKTPHPKAKPGEIRPFHCKLTTVSAKKAKVLIASLFPEEIFDKKFIGENLQEIQSLRHQLNVIEGKEADAFERKMEEYHVPNKLLLGPNEMFLEGAYFYNGWLEETEKEPVLLLGPNEMRIR